MARTDMTGTQDASWSHYPFGGEWTTTGPSANQHHFTGHLRDTESGNEYAEARYLDTSAAHWLGG